MEKDVAFGPKNMGLPKEEIARRVKEALQFTGIGEELAESSPFDLSGGQKRRVAIAGVIAMQPEVLVLDEPAAGLDPRGREEIFSNVQAYQRTTGKTVVIVSHSMEDMARYAEDLIVMNEGKPVLSGSCKEVFAHRAELEKTGLAVPQITTLMERLRELGMPVSSEIYTVEEAKNALLPLLEGGRSMLKDITLGQFFPGKSLLHRLDPRTKILCTILLVVIVFLAKSMLAYGVLLLLTGILMALSRIPLRTLLKSVKPLIIVILLTSLLNMFFTSGENVLVDVRFWFFHIVIRAEGVVSALKMALRIILLVLDTSVVLTYTTSPIDLTDGIERLLSPLAKLKVPVHTFAMMMSLALRFIPTLVEETEKIIAAQKSRGADFTSGNSCSDG